MLGEEVPEVVAGGHPSQEEDLTPSGFGISVKGALSGTSAGRFFSSPESLCKSYHSLHPWPKQTDRLIGLRGYSLLEKF